MDKATKLTHKNCINNFENNLNNVKKDSEILIFLIAQQKQFIKNCQDENMDENAIESQISVLYQLEEALEKADYAVSYLEEVISRLKFVKGK